MSRGAAVKRLGATTSNPARPIPLACADRDVSRGDRSAILLLPMSPDPSPRTALDIAHAIGQRLAHLFRTTEREPLRAMVDAAHAETEARNDHAVKAQPVACRAGCAFCCHQQVSATAAEILIIAQRIMAEKPQTRGPIRAAVKQADAATRGLDPMERWELRRACPLLNADNLCRIYEDRPFGCRAYASLDRGACETAFEDPSGHPPTTLPRSQPMRLNGVMMSYALEQALRILGLAPHAYDLNHGLAIALDIGPRAAMQRYLAGAEVLAPARISVGREPAADRTTG